MRVIAHLTEIRSGHEETRIVEVPDSASVTDFFDTLGVFAPEIEGERYYPVQNQRFGIGSWHIQFVITDDGVRWTTSYSEILLRDFFRTHRVSNNEIYIRWGAGGKGGTPIDYLHLWQEAYAMIDHVVVLASAGGLLLKAGKSITSRLRRRTPPDELRTLNPGWVFSLIGSRKSWNASELAELLKTTRERAKEHLRYSGYRYDNSRKMYVATDATEDIFNALNAPVPKSVPSSRKRASKQMSR